MSIVGSVIKERYEIVAELGKGGMSTVYLARDKNLDSYWAIKQVKNNNSVDAEAFKKEVELLATLNHPDLPRIVDRIETADSSFFGYKTHIAMSEERIITAATITTGEKTDGKQLETLI